MEILHFQVNPFTVRYIRQSEGKLTSFHSIPTQTTNAKKPPESIHLLTLNFLFIPIIIISIVIGDIIM